MASVENGDQEDCQMQPLDLSCPKVSEVSESDEDLSPVSRPRSSSGGSDPEFEAGGAKTPRDLVKAAASYRNYWPASAAAAAPAAGLHPILGGPARKRFLTKYLHKENGESIIIRE